VTRDDEPVPVMFRSAETGRYLFGGKWPARSIAMLRFTARHFGLTEEEFIHRALERYIAAHPLPDAAS
jgi:hypothetical protein